MTMATMLITATVDGRPSGSAGPSEQKRPGVYSDYVPSRATEKIKAIIFYFPENLPRERTGRTPDLGQFPDPIIVSRFNTGFRPGGYRLAPGDYDVLTRNGNCNGLCRSRSRRAAKFPLKRRGEMS
jgi:hypothetical protein